MTNDEVVEMMLAATTREECHRAKRAARLWIEHNPHDDAGCRRILQAGEQLYMISAAIDYGEEGWR